MRLLSSLPSLSLPLLLLSLLPRSCNGWGTLGHEMVANIAWHRLTCHTKSWINDLLGPQNHTEDAGSPLAAVADWADRVRHFKPWSAPLHYIDVRDDLYKHGCHYQQEADGDLTKDAACSFDFERDCPNDICVAGAIVNFTTQLLPEKNDRRFLRQSSDKKTHPKDDNWPQNQALRFVTHFIGDIHQPLHCSRTTDKGGNDFHVHFNFNVTSSPSRRDLRASSHHSWNLHSVWDTGIIDVALLRDYKNSREEMEKDLISQIDDASASQYLQCGLGYSLTCTQIWGQESFALALQYAYEMEDGDEVEDGSTLTEKYYETRLPIVKEQLIAGGIRLAATLEGLHQEMTRSQQQPYDGEDQDSQREQPPQLAVISSLRLGFAM